jgi:ABC-type branched-subunit amino acid transport system ATPase component/ABC-type branched-subunit amino acid transport system permease subunit
MSPVLHRLIPTAAIVALIGLAVLAPPFIVTLFNFIGIGALVALGLVVMTGLGGLTSFGQAAFVGIGAFSTAWATTALGVSPWLGLVLAIVFSGAAAALLGAATLRLGGHYLPLSTIAWGLAIFFLFPEIPGLGQHDGISNIPPISLFGLSLADNRPMYGLIWVIVAISLLLVGNLLSSREGRAIRALRGGGVMLASLGVSLFRIRLSIFVLSAVLAGIAGWLYAHMTRFVSPSPFEIRPSIEYLLMALAGGASSVYGAVIGAAFVVLLKNAVQDILPAFTANAAQFEIIVYSVVLILLLQHARGGILPLVSRLLPRIPVERLIADHGLPRRILPKGGTPLLEIEGAVKRFGGLMAVNDVSFEMKSGEILGLIGPNGAGKSTMFNLITGAAIASGGRFRFLGTDITRLSQRARARLGIARSFQHVKLRPTMTLIDNVLLGTYLRTRAGFLAGALRLDRSEETVATREAMDQLARVGLADKAEMLAGNLPLGHQRILEVARALAADPVLLVLDEPAAGLRKGEKQALADLLRKLRDEGVSILLVEHDMEFVMGLVDRLVVMSLGKKLADGLPDAVRSDASVQEAYLGSAA